MADNSTNNGKSLFLTADELAALLNVSKRTIWRMKILGAIPPSVRIGRSVRWQRSTIMDWIARGCPAVNSLLSNIFHSLLGVR